MDVFKLRDAVVNEYRDYVESFVRVLDPGVDQFVRQRLASCGPTQSCSSTRRSRWTGR